MRNKKRGGGADSDPMKLTFSDNDLARQLFGERNQNLQKIAEATDLAIHARGNSVFIQGDSIAADLARNVLKQLYGLLQDRYPVYPDDVDYAIQVLSANDRVNLKKIFLDTVYITSKKRSITPKSLAQKEYIDAIRNTDMVFGVGPAGTGKT